MRAYRKVEDRYELRIDSGRLALLSVGAALALLLVFLLGVLVGKGLWGGKRVASLPLAASVGEAPQETTADSREETQPKLTFYEDLKKPDAPPGEAEQQSPPAPVSVPGPEAQPAGRQEPAAAEEPPKEAGAAKAPAAETTRRHVAPAKKPPAPVFTVQVGSFRDRGAADDLAHQVAAQDASAQVVPTSVAGRTWYRVQVGRFETRSAAEAHYRHRLKPRGIQGFVTTR